MYKFFVFGTAPVENAEILYFKRDCLFGILKIEYKHVFWQYS